MIHLLMEIHIVNPGAAVVAVVAALLFIAWTTIRRLAGCGDE